MTRRWLSIGFAAGLLLSVGIAATAAAHSGDEASGLSVEPDSLQAGGTVVLVGTGLEPDSDRVLVLAGPDETIELGTVKTDAQGMLQKEIKIPAHLPGGSYELRAIGDETLTVQLAVTAADGASTAAGGSVSQATVVPHERHLLEIGLLGAGVLVLLVLGTVLIVSAERFGHTSTPAET